MFSLLLKDLISDFYLPCEPRHDKTNKMSVRPAKTQISLGIHPVWSESSLCAQWVAKDPGFLHADSEDSDQTGRMPRLIWVFAVRTATLLVLICHGSCMEGSLYTEQINYQIHLWLWPQFLRSWWGILASGCPSLRPSVRSSRTVHAKVLKFWNFVPGVYGFLMKNSWHTFSSCPSYIPFWSYAPLNKS